MVRDHRADRGVRAAAVVVTHAVTAGMAPAVTAADQTVVGSHASPYGLVSDDIDFQLSHGKVQS